MKAMNDTLKAWARKTICAPRGISGSGSRPSDELVLVSKTDEKKGRSIVRVSFHARAIKQLGWIKNDRLTVAVSDTGKLVISRAADGRQLGVGNSKTTRNYVRFAVDPEFYKVIPAGTGKNVEIEFGAIAFDL